MYYLKNKAYFSAEFSIRFETQLVIQICGSKAYLMNKIFIVTF